MIHYSKKNVNIRASIMSTIKRTTLIIDMLSPILGLGNQHGTNRPSTIVDCMQCIHEEKQTSLFLSPRQTNTDFSEFAIFQDTIEATWLSSCYIRCEILGTRYGVQFRACWEQLTARHEQLATCPEQLTMRIVGHNAYCEPLIYVTNGIPCIRYPFLPFPRGLCVEEANGVTSLVPRPLFL